MTVHQTSRKPMFTHTIFIANAQQDHVQLRDIYPRAAQYLTQEHGMGDCSVSIALKEMRARQFI